MAPVVKESRLPILQPRLLAVTITDGRCPACSGPQPPLASKSFLPAAENPEGAFLEIILQGRAQPWGTRTSQRGRDQETPPCAGHPCWARLLCPGCRAGTSPAQLQGSSVPAPRPAQTSPCPWCPWGCQHSPGAVCCTRAGTESSRLRPSLGQPGRACRAHSTSRGAELHSHSLLFQFSILFSFSSRPKSLRAEAG